MRYLPRTLDAELDELLSIAPAIAIDGPKGVGKTVTARRRAATTWTLDNPDQRRIAAADFELASAPKGTLLIDEWQRLPEVWDSVRRRVDDGAAPGSFLLTGSATPTGASGTHSGAGRILSLRMRPMGLYERGLSETTVSLAGLLQGRAAVEGESPLGLPDYAEAIVNSGFPGIMQAHPRLRPGMLDAYLHRIIDREIPDLGARVRRPETLRRWLASYAAASSLTTSYSRILVAATGGDGTQPASTTTITYRDLLTQIWILDPLPGWLPANNAFKRNQQAPKHQLADPALAARLLNLSAGALLGAAGAHMMGQLFESLAALTVRVAAQAAGARVLHLRYDGGRHEVDLIVEGADGQIVAIEVKLAAAIDDSDVRHLKWLRDQIPDRVAGLVVINAGRAAYRRPDGVAVVPLALLGA